MMYVCRQRKLICVLLREFGGIGLEHIHTRQPVIQGSTEIVLIIQCRLQSKVLVNLRDNGIYCRGPIYLRKQYFEYYLDQRTVLRFNADELFYFANHSIQRRGGHLFVCDYGSQLNILNRYGIPSHSVEGRDYYFKNGDKGDFRTGNIVILNHYHGVLSAVERGHTVYTARIHVNGDLIIGRYDNETDAAIAYNKAAGILKKKGIKISFQENYIENITDEEYRSRYEKIKISRKITEACI